MDIQSKHSYSMLASSRFSKHRFCHHVAPIDITCTQFSENESLKKFTANSQVQYHKNETHSENLSSRHLLQYKAHILPLLNNA